MDFGQRIKEIRLRRKFTLEELAKRANVSASFLSQIERGVVYPSIQSLRRIATALDVKLDYFFKEQNLQRTRNIVKKDEREKFFLKDSNALVEILSSSGPEISMEPLIFTVEPKGHTGKHLSIHEGEEFGLVLEGKIEVEIGKESYTLQEGDSICFNSMLPHKFRNTANVKAKVLWVVLSPRRIM
ncbi:cupin domain-containing protein [bacterium]|nr:cupin domain-containing protein [bacterium]